MERAVLDSRTLLAAMRRSQLLSDLTIEQLKTLLGLSKKCRLAKGEVFYREGDKGDSLAIVLDGKLRVEISDNQGKPQALGNLFPGQVVGEMACLDPAPRSATVTAAEPSTTMVVDARMLDLIIKGSPVVGSKLILGIIKEITQRIRQTNGHVERILREIDAMGERDTSALLDDPVVSEIKVARGRLYQAKVDLSTVKSLAFLGAEGQGILLSVVRPMVFEPGEYICRQGDLGTACYLVIKGRVEVQRMVLGKQRRMARLTECLVGYMSLIDPLPRSASIRCLDRCLVLELDRDNFRRLLEATTPVAVRFQKLVARAGIFQIREANKLVSRITSTPSTQKPYEEPVDAGKPDPKDEKYQQAIAYMKASLQMWGMNPENLDLDTLVNKVAQEHGSRPDPKNKKNE